MRKPSNSNRTYDTAVIGIIASNRNRNIYKINPGYSSYSSKREMSPSADPCRKRSNSPSSKRMDYPPEEPPPPGQTEAYKTHATRPPHRGPIPYQHPQNFLFAPWLRRFVCITPWRSGRGWHPLLLNLWRSILTTVR